MTGPGPNNHKQGWHGPRPEGFRTLNRWSAGMWKKHIEPGPAPDEMRLLAMRGDEPVRMNRGNLRNINVAGTIAEPPPLLKIEVPVDQTRRSSDPYTGSQIGELLDKLASFHDDPLGFVRWAFPWGEKGTMLEDMAGPEEWQREQLIRIGKAIREGGQEGCVIEEDVASGHGIGKSAEVSWMILWAISTCADTRGIVTANTDTQLRTKTWAELGKWYQLFIGRQLFTFTATAIFIAGDPDRQKTWRIDQIPWSKERSEAFAGMHNQGKRILVIFDEASAIDDLIWDVTEGALTDAKTQILWLRYGNPTKTSGRFFKNCLAADTPVLTDKGWVPIQDVSSKHLVWDGEEWVENDGAVKTGHFYTQSVFGVRMTPDHLVLTTEGWRNGQACEGLERAAVRLPDGDGVFGAAQTGGTVAPPVRLRGDNGSADRRLHPNAEQSPGLSRLPAKRAPEGPWVVAASDLRRSPQHAGQVQQSSARGMAKLWRARDYCVRSVARLLSVCRRHVADLQVWAVAGAARQRQGLQSRQLLLGYATGATQQHPREHLRSDTERAVHAGASLAGLRRAVQPTADAAGGRVVTRPSAWRDVYDIVNCGPRSRFVVAGEDGQPLIVHNCTQGKRNTYVRVDSRTVSFTNKGQIAAWVEEYGEDSDFVRVRVRGEFPRAGYANFISPELVSQARRRRLQAQMYQSYPKILAVDPARFGDDFSVITLRQGLRVHFQVALSGFDGVDLASRVFEIVRKEGPISCIAYDAIGNGADLDSALRRMQGLPALIPVTWGVPAKDEKQYFNQRSECWGKMRDFLENGQIPDDDGLAEELISLDYGYDAKFRIQLQSKKDLKKAGSKSPDKADSLALSFVPDLIDRKVTIARVKPVPRRTVVWTR